MIGTFSLDQQARAHFISRAPHLISTTCPFLSLVYNHRCGDVEIFSPWEETWKDRLEYLDQIDNSLSFRNEIRHEGVHLRRSDTRPSSLPSWIWHCSTGITGSEALVHGLAKARVQIFKQRGDPPQALHKEYEISHPICATLPPDVDVCQSGVRRFSSIWAEDSLKQR